MHDNNVTIGQRVKDRWYMVLSSLGIEKRFLVNKHGPCPLCGGKDRYRWDDKNGRGTYYCQCGPGDGFQLLMKFNNWTFPETAQRIEEILGDIPKENSEQKYKPDPSIALKLLQRESCEIQLGDEVTKYLAGRGLFEIPQDLKSHPGLYDPESCKNFPAMLGLVRGPKGILVSIHRTFIQSGKKAPIASPRKIMPPVEMINGAAIRLYPLREHIGIAEGIETAMAAHQLFGLPVWSVLNTNGINTFIPPEGIREITIFADNDLNFAGQSAAFALANRLSLKGFKAQVKFPEISGQDWWDVYKSNYE